MSCSAVSCSSRTTKGGVKHPDFSFHPFPKCPEIRSEWIKAEACLGANKIFQTVFEIFRRNLFHHQKTDKKNSKVMKYLPFSRNTHHIINRSEMAEYDTIVVGLGAAGAAAAGALAAAGRRVLALEAQDRVGGRVHTVPFAGGVVELGAEWIHGTEQSPVYELGVQRGVELRPQELSFSVHMSDGSSERAQLASELTAYMLQLQDNLPTQPLPLGHYLAAKVRERIAEKYPEVANDTAFVDSFLDFCDLLIGNYEACDSWNQVTTASSFRELGGHQHMSWHKHGYKTLLHILLNTHAGGPGYPALTVRLNSEVTRIQWGAHPVRVCTRDHTYTAHNVIVTMSLGVLKERSAALFSPPLPAPKVEAIRALDMGLLDKVIFSFAEPWWSPGEFFHGCWAGADRAALADDEGWLARVTMFSNPLGAHHALTVWFSGERAKLVETLPDEEVRSKLMGVIRRFMGRGRTIPEPTAMLRSSWYSNPFTRGSYTYDSVASPQHPDARAELARPLLDDSGAPRLLFAGEATHSTYFSTVHGAVATGYREARRLLPASKM